LQVLRTEQFAEWLRKLPDRQARARILVRIDRMENDNPGVARSVGEGVFEMKIDYGPGYRVYYVRRGATVIVLLCGGDKSTQKDDIRRAKTLAALWREGN